MAIQMTTIVCIGVALLLTAAWAMYEAFRD